MKPTTGRNPRCVGRPTPPAVPTFHGPGSEVSGRPPTPLPRYVHSVASVLEQVDTWEVDSCPLSGLPYADIEIPERDPFSYGMSLEFECECGNDISDRSSSFPNWNTQLRCLDCGAVYAVTVSQLSDGDGTLP